LGEEIGETSSQTKAKGARRKIAETGVSLRNPDLHQLDGVVTVSRLA
jgi:hypothetical protein